MKELGKRLRALQIPPRLSRWDWLLTLAPLGLWYLAIHLRPHLVFPRCTETPETCVGQRLLFPLDQVALTWFDGTMDDYSFMTQNSAGFLALAVPILWAAAATLRDRMPWRRFLPTVGTDWLLLGQATLWNGVAMEFVRLVFQRPRPFVYQNPVELGRDPSHYTSFYSGHTSFAALATTCLVIGVFSRGAPRGAVFIALLGGAALTTTTGVLRVLAGRHFPTDVITGAFAGILIALAIALIHRPTATR